MSEEAVAPEPERFAVKPEAARAALDALAERDGWTLVKDRFRIHGAMAERWWGTNPGAVMWVEDPELGERWEQFAEGVRAYFQAK